MCAVGSFDSITILLIVITLKLNVNNDLKQYKWSECTNKTAIQDKV